MTHFGDVDLPVWRTDERGNPRASAYVGGADYDAAADASPATERPASRDTLSCPSHRRGAALVALKMVSRVYSFVATLLKILVPTSWNAAIAATAIRAAIKPYSIAVAPFWSRANAGAAVVVVKNAHGESR